MTRSTSSSANSSSHPRYDLGLNPPYQINFRAKRAGKHITASKRRITFQFGFSSASAIKSGRTEVECRGEEHEIVLIWSHMTGKRQIYMDGREVHMSKAARGNTKFEYSWGIQGGHTLKIVAHGTPQPNYYRQFDLELDGMSFFEFSKIYELGGRSNGSATEERDMPAIGYSYRGLAYDARDDDEVEGAQPPMPEVKVTSLDLFDSEPSILSPMTITNFSSIPSLVGSSSSNSTSDYDEFAPVECSNQKSFDSISNEILCAYGSTNAAPSAADSAPSTSRALVPVSEEGMDQISKSMKNLVNLDDISTTPIQPLAAPTSSLNKQKSLPSWALVGREPTLAELRAQSPTVPTNVMKMQQQQPVQSYHHAQPQAMVSYQGAGAGAPSYGYYGAPAY